jgi:hypothetical protein
MVNVPNHFIYFFRGRKSMLDANCGWRKGKLEAGRNDGLGRVWAGCIRMSRLLVLLASLRDKNERFYFFSKINTWNNWNEMRSYL